MLRLAQSCLPRRAGAERSNRQERSEEKVGQVANLPEKRQVGDLPHLFFRSLEGQ